MDKKILQVIDQGYRCTIEEQDDPVIWITQVMRGAGANLDLLLCGSAVNYAVRDQDASGLCFGDRKQTQPPRVDQDVARLVEKGATVYVMAEDAAERGLVTSDLVAGVQSLPRESLANLYDRYAEIWHW